MIDFPDEAHLLHSLEVEIMHLIHDLSHPHVNVLKVQGQRGRLCWPGHGGSSWVGVKFSPQLLTAPTDVAASKAMEASCLALKSSRQPG